MFIVKIVTLHSKLKIYDVVATPLGYSRLLLLQHPFLLDFSCDDL